MPIYEYRCQSCETKFEKLVRRATDAMETGCPSCGDKHLEQQYSTFAARGGTFSASRDDASFTPAQSRSCEGGMCGTPGLCGHN